LLLFFKSFYIGKDLRDVKSANTLRVVEKLEIKDVGPFPNMDNVVG